MEQPYKGLQVVDLIGVFYEEDTRLMVADEYDGAQDVLEVLEPLMRYELRILAHHRPVEPVDEERWGGGCCFYESSGFCPFGHHEDPANLYTFNAVGKLRVEGQKLFVDDGEESKECLVHFLVGHRSQIVITSIPDLDELDEKVKSFDPSNIENPTLENLTERLGELRVFMSKMNDLKNDL